MAQTPVERATPVAVLLRPRALLALAALFSGVALLAHILAGYSLPLTLLLTTGLMVLAARGIWRRASRGQRARLARLSRTGLTAGLLATVAYDVSKFTLSRFDPSPYNPFEVIRIFGRLLVGNSAPLGVTYAAGTSFHLLNGLTFATSYCFLLGGTGVLTGIAWGLFLELFQLTLYPGWLNIKFYTEFATISALSHVVYGAVLGLCCRTALPKE